MKMSFAQRITRTRVRGVAHTLCAPRAYKYPLLARDVHRRHDDDDDYPHDTKRRSHHRESVRTTT